MRRATGAASNLLYVSTVAVLLAGAVSATVGLVMLLLGFGPSWLLWSLAATAMMWTGLMAAAVVLAAVAWRDDIW